MLKYSAFLTILSIVVYGNRNSQSFCYYDNLKKILDSDVLYVSANKTSIFDSFLNVTDLPNFNCTFSARL